MRSAKMAAALVAALSAVGADPLKPKAPRGRPPRRFTDARLAAAEAKRQRKAAKRLANLQRAEKGEGEH